MKNDKIENIYRKNLENLKVTPDDRLWLDIRSRLNQKKRKRIFYYYSAAASILLLVGFSIIYLLNENIFDKNQGISDIIVADSINIKRDSLGILDENKDLISHDIEIVDTNKIKDNIVRTTKDPIETDIKTETSTQLLTEQNVINTSKNKNILVSDKNIGQLKEQEKQEIIVVNDNKLEPDLVEKDTILPTNIIPDKEQKIIATKEEKEVEEDKQKIQLTDKTESLNEKELIQQTTQIDTLQDIHLIDELNITDENENKKPKKLLALSGQFSSNYSYRKASETNNNQSDKGIWNTGGGIKIDINPSNKLAIRTGIKYGKFGQETKGSTNAGNVISDNPLFSIENSTSSGKINYSNEAISELSEELISTSSSETKLRQEFESIEIPLGIKYNLSNGKVGLNIIGGVSTNFIIDNRVLLDNQKIGKVDNIRKINFSADFSFLVEYPISEKVKFNIEPGMKYYINSISKDNAVKFNPYLFGISTGISIYF